MSVRRCNKDRILYSFVSHARRDRIIDRPNPLEIIGGDRGRYARVLIKSDFRYRLIATVVSETTCRRSRLRAHHALGKSGVRDTDRPWNNIICSWSCIIRDSDDQNRCTGVIIIVYYISLQLYSISYDGLYDYTRNQQ